MIRGAAPLLIAAVAACSSLPAYPGEPPMPVRDEGGVSARAMAAARAAVPASPAAKPPSDPEARSVWQAALDARGERVVVSREARALWLVGDEGVVFRAPVAVGRHEPFEYAGKRYDFRTPIMRRKVLSKATSPLWVPPDWHYFEIAAEQDLKPVHLKKGSRIALSDSTAIEVRGDQVGRLNQFGNFWPFTPGTEIIFEGRIFIPPIGSAQRRVPEVLGTHKLELGDGYLIHGTNANGSIGDAVSHGCVRMFNEDVEQLYALVPIGTPVFVY